jgi:hypothetical protein
MAPLSKQALPKSPGLLVIVYTTVTPPIECLQLFTSIVIALHRLLDGECIDNVDAVFTNNEGDPLSWKIYLQISGRIERNICV